MMEVYDGPDRVNRPPARFTALALGLGGKWDVQNFDTRKGAAGYLAWGYGDSGSPTAILDWEDGKLLSICKGWDEH